MDSRHINPDHFLETPGGRLYTPERSVLAWHQAYAALDHALSRAPTGSTLFLVIGVQGGGKTAWVRRHIAALGDSAYFFDAALPGIEHRRKALEIAKRHGVPVVAVWLDTALALALDRNRARREDHRVPEAAIRSVHARFEASLSYLGDLPLDELKIDRMFVSKMLRSSKHRSIVRSTIALAHELDLTVVAEGAEDHSTLAALKEDGCDRAQGYVISDPMTETTFKAFLKGRPGPVETARALRSSRDITG